jgi:anti-sigma-K factor RskA
VNPQDYENLAPLYALGALDGEDLARFTEELERSESLRALVLEHQNASIALPLSLGAVTPPAGLKSRVLAAATGEKAPRPAILTRLFWAAAAIVLFSFVVRSLSISTEVHDLDLKGTKHAPAAKGRIHCKGQTVELEVSGLPALPAGKVYQLWHLRAGPAPVGARTFTLGASGELQGRDTMKNLIALGQGFALTMEPAGGSLKPTLPIYAEVK